MCNFNLKDAFKLDPLDLLGRRQERKAKSEANIATAAIESQNLKLEEEKRKKKIARAPIETVFGGSQVQQEGGVTLGQ